MKEQTSPMPILTLPLAGNAARGKVACAFPSACFFFTFLVVAILTAVVLVVAALTISKLIAPRSFNPQKGEPYECGIPTRGQSWVQFKAGYYLFAILFLMFDIETVFLFPWANVVNEVGAYALVCVSFFLLVLILGLAYAWRKGALEWK